jgi:hypothetical protein
LDENGKEELQSFFLNLLNLQLFFSFFTGQVCSLGRKEYGRLGMGADAKDLAILAKWVIRNHPFYKDKF